MGRGLSRVLLLVGLLGALLISLGLAASGTPGDEWRIQDHVILEDEVMTVERNITVVEGGWLDLLCQHVLTNAVHRRCWRG